MFKTNFFVRGIVFVILLFGLGFAGQELAKVGGQSITSRDLEERLTDLPQEQEEYYSSEEGRKNLLEMMINEKALYLEAKEAGIEENPQFQQFLQENQGEFEETALLLDFYIREELSGLEVSEQEVDRFYQENKERFQRDETFQARHILVEEENQAKKIIASLVANEDFAELAKEYSSCPSGQTGGQLNNFTRGQMVKPFEDAVFSLEVGEITEDPVETQFGWHVIRLEGKQPPGQQELAEIRDGLHNALLREKQQDALESLIIGARNKQEVEIKI